MPADRAEGLRILRKPFAPGAAVDAMDIKCEADIAWLRHLVDRCGSIGYARIVAERYARHFQRRIDALLCNLPQSQHRDFLAELADFTVNREF